MMATAPLLSRRALLTSALVALVVGACAPLPARTGRPAPLSADSAALLARAVRLANPGFRTQQEALRAGAYRPPETLVLEPTPRREAAPAPLSSFVIQIAAFRDRASADVLAREAREWFPELEPIIEVEGDFYRVALGERASAAALGWPTAAEAERVVGRLRERYPTAWIRRRNVP